MGKGNEGLDQGREATKQEVRAVTILSQAEFATQLTNPANSSRRPGISQAKDKVGGCQDQDKEATYWDIENGLHYRRDKTLREDATRMTDPIQAQVMAIINNLVVALAKRQGFDNLPAARRYYAASLLEALNLLLSLPP